MSIDPEALFTKVKHQCPDCFNAPNAAVTEAIVKKTAERVDANGQLTCAQAITLVKETRRSLPPHRSIRAFKLVVDALEAVNLTGDAVCAMPRRLHRPMREKTIAKSTTRFAQQATAHEMDQYLDRWLRERAAENAMDSDLVAALAFAMRLVVRAGMGADLVSGGLARLTPARVTAHGSLRLPIDTANFTAAFYCWPLPKGCWGLLPAAIRKGTRDDVLLFPDALGEPIDTSLPEDPLIDAVADKQKAITDTLSRAFRVFEADFRRDNPNLRVARLQSWTTFCEVGRLIPLGRGIPAALIELGRRFPLPACTDLHALNERGAHQPARLSETKLASSPIQPPSPGTAGLTAPPGGEWFNTEVLPNDWAVEAQRILKRFCQDAEALQGKNGFVTKRNHRALKNQRDKRWEEVNALWQGQSLVHVALGWLYELAVSPAKTSTLRTYISRLFGVETLKLEPAIDLSLWDDDTVEGMTQAIIASRTWQRTTVGHFKQTWADFLRYAQRNGHIPDVENLPSGVAHVHTAKRVDILTAYDVKFLWNHCCHHGGEWGEQAAAAILLGFYGGLRAHEVLSLTLEDVAIKDDSVCVQIAQGKTTAAQRTIWLEIMAPPKLVRWFKAVVEARRQQFTNPRFKDRRLNQIALFGPSGNPDRYTRKALIDPVIDWMREHLDGSVDFHLLRHSFVSWLMLRLYAARNEGFAETLPQKDATMFQPESLERLRALFGSESCRGSGIDDHIHFKNFVGHEDLRTSILHYVHTLDWIHADIMRRAYNEGSRLK
ncbi:site-specific integrase [Spiribacter sp. 221]|uniref:tyrosine-type recombinase/integrase n=1 Tax=Spiribacter onubensis TaxID=3122420 RepID=UPI00349F7510